MPLPKTSVEPVILQCFIDRQHCSEFRHMAAQTFVDTFLALNAFTLDGYYRIHQRRDDGNSYLFVSCLTSPVTRDDDGVIHMGKKYVIYWNTDMEHLFPGKTQEMTLAEWRETMNPGG